MEEQQLNSHEVIKKKARERFKLKYHTDEEFKKNKLEYNETLKKNKPELFKKYKEKFHEKHPDYFKEYNPVYYQSNRERILKDVGQKVLCDCCQKQIRKDYLHKHIQKPYHIKNELKHK